MTERTLSYVRDRRLTAIGIVGFAVALAAASQIAVPVPGTPVPMTLQPMAVVLAGLWLGPWAGAASMLLYLVAGAAGLPVFAPMGAPGLARLVGPTGGYLLSYPLAAFVAGAVARRLPRYAGRVLAGALAFLVIYAGGVAQLALLTGSIAHAAMLGSAPFVLADVGKVLVAGLLGPARAHRARA